MVDEIVTFVPLALRRCARPIAGAVLFLHLGSMPSAACTGDCDRDGVVVVSEAVRGVAIALGQSPVSACASFDRDGNGTVTVAELLQAVNAILAGCGPDATITPGRTQTPIPTSTATAAGTSTPTPPLNQPPLLPSASIYRTYPDAPIELPLGVIDPEGGPVQCHADVLPDGASLADGVFNWTPSDEQLGPFYVPYTCTDAAVPPGSADGQLTFKVSPRDACVLASCDPASGCTHALPPLDAPCCTDAVIPRVAEPEADCPAGRVTFIGRNPVGFGRLQDCDKMRFRVFQQSGAQISFNVETRCLSTLNRVKVATHIETRDRVVVDAIAFVFLAPDPDGYDRARRITFEVMGGGPFFDLENAEANVTVTVTDSDGMSATERLRVLLTSTPISDLPEVGTTFTPTASPTETPPPG